jgi:hypothetical protein
LFLGAGVDAAASDDDGAVETGSVWGVMLAPPGSWLGGVLPAQAVTISVDMHAMYLRVIDELLLRPSGRSMAAQKLRHVN